MLNNTPLPTVPRMPCQPDPGCDLPANPFGHGQHQPSDLATTLTSIVGYKGTQDYLSDCKNNVAHTHKAVFNCNISDVANRRAWVKPDQHPDRCHSATLLVIVLAAWAAYAFAWLDFKGRQWLFALLIGLQIVPLQMSLVPIAQLYVNTPAKHLSWASGSSIPVWPAICHLPDPQFRRIAATRDVTSRLTWMEPTIGLAFRRLALPLSCHAGIALPGHLPVHLGLE